MWTACSGYSPATALRACSKAGRGNSKAAALLRALEQGFLRRLEDRLSHQQSGCPRGARRQREPLVPQRGACCDSQLTTGSLAQHTLGINGFEMQLLVFDV